ncbi:hypothetical protein [Akkermansia glycaniphila]|uniref:Uncharacterized protein n=1 Tax=Akkermansia glycaniphila TaxID=1679444 RepID=A0A1H6LQA4_9BACT|nr:hypothetical protein [Akkermansia glycaniphila]SEH87649.1 Hypothetical protein PYTT_1389 [Akkermansia glycaniphila]
MNITDKAETTLEEIAKDTRRPHWQRILGWLGWIIAAGITAAYNL